MQEKGNIGSKERIEIITRDMDSNIIDIEVIENVITKLTLNLYRDALADQLANIDDIAIGYVGWGTGTTLPTENDTLLVSEQARKALTDDDYSVDKKYTCICYVAPAEWIGTIEEIGWFAGTGDISGINTGTLIARALYHKVKTALFSIQINRIDTFSEV